MEDEFDPAALEELISQALAEEIVPTAKVTLSLYEGRVLERLAVALPRHLGAKATLSVMRELRDELFVRQADTSWAALSETISRCRRCPGLMPPSVPTQGNLANPDLLVIVESLSSRDGNPEAIIGMLEEAGLARTRVALTGLTRCPGAAAPEDIDRCSEFLMTEIEILQPSLVMTVGSTVTQSLLGPDVKISEARGTIWWVGPWSVLPVYSPGYATRGGRPESDLKTDLAIARRHLDG